MNNQRQKIPAILFLVFTLSVASFWVFGFYTDTPEEPFTTPKLAELFSHPPQITLSLEDEILLTFLEDQEKAYALNQTGVQDQTLEQDQEDPELRSE